MKFEVKNVLVSDIYNWHKNGELDTQPPYQRRKVWDDKKKMILIDSIVRGIPINAITIYESSEDEKKPREVIDGQQRLSAIFEFIGDGFKVEREVIEENSEDETEEGKNKAEHVFDKLFSELDAKSQSIINKYDLTYFLISGQRASAVRAFKRMNEQGTPLTPQEIRNAVFRKSYFLECVKGISEELNKISCISKSFLMDWGILKENQYNRMADLLFLSEILHLKKDGPQNARRKLDEIYSAFNNSGEKIKKPLKRHATDLVACVKVLYDILGKSLVPHFNEQNKIYSLIGAFLRDSLYKAKELNDKNAKMEIRELLISFGNQVVQYIEFLNMSAEQRAEEKVAEDSFDGSVKDYGSTLLKGQINSDKRREKRISILHDLLRKRLTAPDNKKPSEFQRRLVWVKSDDKICKRCNNKVDSYEDYDCGHITAGLHGGRCIISNLQVEHKSCNRRHNQHSLKKT